MDWKSIIEDKHLRNFVEEKINCIFNTIVHSRPNKSYGLLGGYAGVVLFLYYYYRHTKKEEALSLLHEIFNLIFSEFLQFGHASFCNGFSGITWLIRFLTDEEIIYTSNIEDDLNEIDNYISQFMLFEMQNNNFDFLHGSLGMAYYFATQKSNEKTSHVIKKFLESLNKNKVVNLDGSFKWLSKTYIDLTTEKYIYNLSLSHGMAGIVAFLSKLIEHHNNESQAMDLLDKTVLFYKNNINPRSYSSTFPKWFESNKYHPYESPLSWCYGDPGIGHTLYNAGIIMNDKELVEFAVNSLIKTTSRKNAEKENINEACFCHGSSSLCHIYNRLYQETNIETFKDSAIYWLNDSLTKGNHSTELSGYKFFDSGNIDRDVALLSGLSGVGLSLLATLDPIIPKWDECVLLS